MRRQEREMSEPAFMHSVLAEARQIYLAFNTGVAPYVIAVNHIFHQGALWFHCAAEGRKLELLRADPRVGFFTALNIAQDGATTRYRSVCGAGRAEIIEAETARIEALKAVARRFAAPCRFPVSPRKLAATVIVRIAIEEIAGKFSRRVEDHSAAGAARTHV
jgi:nitroimidazol reductase NimA-like FMN-containing flavoprotein (pyridoxamine 5'-phosphate oxidase superfamily)